MTTFLGYVNDLVTNLVSWIPQITEVIMNDPLLVLPFVILVVGLAVGIIGRLLSLR